MDAWQRYCVRRLSLQIVPLCGGQRRHRDEGLQHQLILLLRAKT